MDKLCPEHEVVVPRMRPKGGPLNPENWKLDHEMSKVCITVKNVVCRIKICREFYRNDIQRRGLFWRCVVRLVSLRTLNRALKFA